jgi:hypothetical protein
MYPYREFFDKLFDERLLSFPWRARRYDVALRCFDFRAGSDYTDCARDALAVGSV